MTKTWFVTGSSRGLGREIVIAALDAGDTVVATARQAKQLDDLVQKYGADRIIPVDMDVTNIDQVTKAVEHAKEKLGKLDIIVNNAGYADVAAVEDMTLDSFRQQFETNFFGVLNVTKAVLPTLREQGHGHVLQVSSIGDRMGSPGLCSYQSAKWAVAGFSTVLAREVAPFGVQVTVLEPGGMSTDWAGPSMGYGHVSDPYLDTVAKFSDLRLKLSADWTPADKVARAIVKVAGIQDAPLRLLLGADTVAHAKKASDDLATNDERWRDLTELKNI